MFKRALKSVAKRTGKAAIRGIKEESIIFKDNVAKEIAEEIEELEDGIREFVNELAHEVLNEVEELIDKKLEAQTETILEFIKENIEHLTKPVFITQDSYSKTDPNPFVEVEPIKRKFKSPTDASEEGTYGVANNPNPTAGKEDG